ncbi:MAG: ATP synthase F1 subunit delta [Bacteroidota bacterium]
MRKIAHRYAEVLLHLAVERDVLVHIHEDIRYFDHICAANKHLVMALNSPIIARSKKLLILQNSFQNEIHALTFSFFTMVTQKHREALLPAMAQAFLRQHDQLHGIKTAQVATTLPLSDRLITHLQHIVQQIAPCQQVILAQTIDPSLIGGYVLQVDDKRLDRSLRKQLLTLQQNCVTEGY